MKTRHTKGKWEEVSERPKKLYEFTSYYVVNEDGYIDIRIKGYNPEKAEANAKLIAAAPEMLKALMNIKHLIEWPHANGINIEAIKSEYNRIIKDTK